MSESPPAENQQPSRTRRRRLFIAVGLVVLLVIGPYIISRIRSPGRRVRVYSDSEHSVPADALPGLLSIVTYNIAHGRGAIDDNWQESNAAKRDRIEQIAQFLAKTNANVVVLNEVDFDSTWSGHQNQAATIAAEAGFAYRVEQRNLDFRFLYGSWKFGNAILSKYPILDAQVVDLPPHADWEDWLVGHKRGVVATLQLPDEQRVRVLAVHLEHRREINRVRGAKAIVDVAELLEVPLIVAGDLNSTPPGFPNARTTADGENAMEILQESGLFQWRPRADPTPSDMTYSSTNPVQIIDWILIPPNATFVAYEVLAGDLSDHRAVSATLRFAD
ncbi:Endonuclease/Exonuclease/phosphatase family protein [Symmachiella macrocystis]|uniref:Endonuclease/Exonuclease/phosphatase family protein n=1 Tax=Symmachiella macrocystis TaxID=2527985 RepID=A0A5C6BM27_9PLAN|nr:endonuclease/exonuclease/phosphatase family protein [Symmachiella macrocystis]TWU12169.1 Endonuclease/Exonuclease/phosphatase family protein [Symmachiella macrocystis]